MKLTSITRDRQEWTARNLDRQETMGRFSVRGDLYREEILIRRNFKVKVEGDGTFKVDIGTGSGVKVAFKFPQ